jgi:hypothetical protein
MARTGRSCKGVTAAGAAALEPAAASVVIPPAEPADPAEPARGDADLNMPGGSSGLRPGVLADPPDRRGFAAAPDAGPAEGEGMPGVARATGIPRGAAGPDAAGITGTEGAGGAAVTAGTGGLGAAAGVKTGAGGAAGVMTCAGAAITGMGAGAGLVVGAASAAAGEARASVIAIGEGAMILQTIQTRSVLISLDHICECKGEP